jgi:arsenite oxidase small subunit
MRKASLSKIPPQRPSRRRFIAAGCSTLSTSLVTELVPPIALAAAAPANTYPRTDIVSIDALKEDVPVAFNYPDASSPALLVQLRESAVGGVGPDKRIVAFSRLCTHKGCPVAYRPERKLFICPCHWSSFDPAKAGQMVIGQGSEPLPQIALELNGKTVQAVGVSGLIFGRETNIL